MGLDIGIEWLTLIMFGSLLVLLMAGLPLAFVTGGLACVFLFVLGDARALNIVPGRIFPLMTNYQLSAIPLFIFLAAMFIYFRQGRVVSSLVITAAAIAIIYVLFTVVFRVYLP